MILGYDSDDSELDDWARVSATPAAEIDPDFAARDWETAARTSEIATTISESSKRIVTVFKAVTYHSSNRCL